MKNILQERYQQARKTANSFSSFPEIQRFSMKPEVVFYFDRFYWKQKQVNVVKYFILYSSDRKIIQLQQKAFQKFAAGDYEEAENFYQNRVFPRLKVHLNSRENILKYNGWLLRWSRMLNQYKEAKNSKIKRQLLQELQKVQLQMQLYLRKKETQDIFQQLLQYFKQQLYENEK